MAVAAAGVPEHEDGSEWVELRPRWPLTSERHASCMASEKLLSAKKARVHTSLTDMTKLELAARAAAGVAAGR